MKKILLTIVNLLLICVLFGFSVCAEETTSDVEPSSEEQTTAVETTEQVIEQPQVIEKYDEKKGIASIRLMYVADTGARDIIKTGYAFFIGDEENIYLISCCDTVILTDKEKKAVADSHSVTADKVKTVIELVLKNDVIVELSVVNSSEDMDFAILQPISKLSACTTIRLCSENNATKKGDVAHAYDADMQEMECTIDDWTEINNAHYYMYHSDYAVTKGLPLMNNDGEVIAIASDTNKGNPDEFYALQIDEVTEVLDVLGISYNPEIVVDTTALDEQVAEFLKLEKKKYTKESWEKLEIAYNNAKDLLKSVEDGEVTSYTQDEVNDLAVDLADRIVHLEKAGITVKTMIIISIIEGAVLLIVIIILSVLLIVKTKKYKKLLKEEENQTVMAKEALKLSGRVTPGFIPNSTNMPVNRSLNDAGNSQQMMDVSPETSVLGVGMNNQSGYLERKMPTYPTIIRYKTGESVVIKNNSFVIGSSADSVDYCVKYNSSISRKHACIMKFEDGYYIQDLDTTNGTYVNGIRVYPGRYTKLANGNVIKLAEEEFEFRG